jgi:hypothetical protein
MRKPYQLAQTFALSDNAEVCIATIGLTIAQLCRQSGITPSTSERLQRGARVNRTTATHVAKAYALIHGGISPYEAMTQIFTPQPRVVMEPSPCGLVSRRR